MKQYIVDAFTDKVFAGNPAAICILEKWLTDELMISITTENNLSETAFAVKEQDGYRLRWFTPGGEIDLCGHATLACAYVLLRFYEKGTNKITFHTLSGDLTVNKCGDFYEMEFPAFKLKQIPVTQKIVEALGCMPKEAYLGRDLMCVFDDEAMIRKVNPDLDKVKELDGLLIHVTAQGKEFDCVSRTFAPKCKVSEDPVCGSGHCHIVPFWADRLNKNNIIAYQASTRGGVLYCKVEDERVILGGKAALFAVSDILYSENEEENKK